MAEPRTLVVAGGGLAGAKAVETVREEGFDGRVVLLGAEPERPYERPPLSKGYLAGGASRDEAFVHPEAFYREHEIELLSGVRAASLDAEAHRLELTGGAPLAYDRLLIATGAIPRRPPIEGVELDGVHVLRTLADADALRERLHDGAAVAIVGGGWIGCEVAAAARTRGAEVALVITGDQPLEHVLGPELGALFADVHREHGVRLITGAHVEAIGGAGRVEHVRVGDGTTLACDTVVVGVGVEPDTALAASGGLRVDDGIVVDELLRTSAPDVFAAGDVASAFHPRYGRHVRVEHWANALNQGIAAGRSLLDRGEPYARLPYFFSDQYDVGMEYVGLHAPSDRVVVRRGGEGRTLRAFWLDGEGRITAGMHVDDWDAIDEIKQLVDSGAQLPD